jgi:hypothetical protein
MTKKVTRDLKNISILRCIGEDLKQRVRFILPPYQEYPKKKKTKKTVNKYKTNKRKTKKNKTK